MGAEHTFFENAIVTQLLLPQTLTASVNTTAMDTVLARANALMLSLGTFVFSGTNSFTLSLEDSDDNSSFDAVVNGANLGQEVNVRWGDQGNNAILDDTTIPTTNALLDTLVLDETGDDNNNYVAEYLGRRQFVRMVITESGTVSVIAAVNTAQIALVDVPRLVFIGDNN